MNMATDQYLKLLSLIDKSRLSSDLTDWAADELLYLECNPEDVTYLVNTEESIRTSGKRVENPANSTLAYLLKLTDQKPLHGIKRTPTSPPDFDFDTHARDEVKHYLVNKYGIEHVTLLGTYNTLKIKGAIKDVCRSLRPEGEPGGFNFEEVNNITKKFILNRNDFDTELAFFWGNVENDPTLKAWLNQNSDIQDAVLDLLGNAKSSGIHAGGIVLSSSEVKAHCPLTWSEDEGVYITQPEMKYVEQLGLIKYDYLGLRTLEDISNTQKLIYKRHGLKLKLSEIKIDEPDVLHEFLVGNTLSVFQFNTPIAVGILTKLKAILNGVRTLAMVTSLGRRGPMNMGMHEVFIRRANGEEPITYLDPALEPILKETLGVIIYQEQVMEVCRVLGDFTGDEALTVMKAMGKKNKTVLASFEKLFLSACAKKKIKVEISQEIWNLMESFAEYGFNKSHAIAYSCMSYLCQWFKTRYPLEWKCSVLMGAEKEDFKIFYSYWKSDISKPDINDSKENYFISTAGKVVMPFTSINGVGDKVVSAIVRHQPYSNFEDFYTKIWDESERLAKESDAIKKRIKKEKLTLDQIKDLEASLDVLKAEKSEYTRALSKGVLSSLILAGCFDVFKANEQHMATHRKSLIKLMVETKHGLKKPDKKTLQEDTELVDTISKMPMKDFLFEELKLLSFSSFDYFDYFKDLIYATAKKHFNMPLLTPAEALKKRPDEVVVVAGAIESVRFFPTKTGKNKGKEMCKIILSHNGQPIEVTIFPKTLELDDKGQRMLRSLQELHPFMVRGKLNSWEGRLSVVYDAGVNIT
jgi:DNA polymerase III alpha subunit